MWCHSCGFGVGFCTVEAFRILIHVDKHGQPMPACSNIVSVGVQIQILFEAYLEARWIHFDSTDYGLRMSRVCSGEGFIREVESLPRPANRQTESLGIIGVLFWYVLVWSPPTTNSFMTVSTIFIYFLLPDGHITSFSLVFLFTESISPYLRWLARALPIWAFRWGGQQPDEPCDLATSGQLRELSQLGTKLDDPTRRSSWARDWQKGSGEGVGCLLGVPTS